MPYVQMESSSKLSFISNRNERQRFSSTIPFDSAWHVYEDGKSIKTENEGGFLSFKVNEGDHTIVLSYEPKGLYAGIAVSAIAVCFVVWLAIRNKTKRKSNTKP